MHNLLALLSGVVAIFAAFPYIRDTLQHKTRPNVVTWFTWSLLNLITAIAALSGHAVQTAIFAFATGACTTVVTLLALRNGFGKYTAFDVICQLLAIGSIVAWKISDRPALAVVFTIAASFIASLPTIRHAWIAAHEETWQFFAIDASSAALACLSVQTISFLSLAFPLYILLDDALIAAIIVSRKRQRLSTPANAA
jgi:hypothetical protein